LELEISSKNVTMEVLAQMSLSPTVADMLACVAGFVSAHKPMRANSLGGDCETVDREVVHSCIGPRHHHDVGCLQKEAGSAPAPTTTAAAVANRIVIGKSEFD
jgi:hypothetical protein